MGKKDGHEEREIEKGWVGNERAQQEKGRERIRLNGDRGGRRINEAEKRK